MFGLAFRLPLTTAHLLKSIKPPHFTFSSCSSMATPANSDWLRVALPNSPPFLTFSQRLQKSEQDDRDYKLIRLDNGLEAMLVHDPNADKAAASLDVGVGHLYDPVDMPGLAHFCEHLLFMGTKQFPKENEYSEFLAKNNGGSNAYTSTSNTNYYFSVSTSALPGALERFSAFFHSPLFSPSCTSRELNAVDSEHKKNHQTDIWRIFQLNKHLSKEGHVWSKFGSGNRDSLSKAAKELKAQGGLTAGSEYRSQPGSLVPSPIPSRIASPAPSVASSTGEAEVDGGMVSREIRRRLVEWWEVEYCASRMRLCIIGQESLDELAELTATLFSPIPNRGQDALPMINEHPFGPNEKGTVVSVQTIMSFHALELSFPLEYQPPFWKHKPSQFLSHFLGHEGPGSLYSYLKSRGWVTSLSCGPQSLARGFGMFKVTIHLTQDGFKNHRDVTLATFKYLTMLRSSKFDAYHQKEMSTISAMRFRFAEKRRSEDYVTWIAEHMAWPVPRDLLLSAPQFTWDWEQNDETAEMKVREYLESFRVHEGRVVLMAKAEEHSKLAPDAVWLKEPWYGTTYYVKKFDEDFIREAQGLNDLQNFSLPKPNEFIPTNLNVEKRAVSKPLKRPRLIRETALSTLWHKKDDQFWVPRAHVIIDLRSPIANASARASVLTRLYSDIVNDSLTEFSYDADLAGLSYNFLPHTTGLFVSMNGYNDKMVVLVTHVLERIKHLEINPQRLDVMKEQAKRDWQNFFLGQSYSLSDYFGRYLMAEQQWTYEEKLRELPCMYSWHNSVTAEDIKDHMMKLLAEVNMRILVTGNMYKDEAIRVAEIAEEGLGSNSALTYYLHFGPIVDQRLRVTASLLTQILTEPAFNILRTKEQLGYIVSCSTWTLPGSSEKGMRIVVQSEKTPGYLEERVESFLRGMEDTISGMSEDEFREQKSGLEKRWLEADKNLADEAGRFVSHINTGHWDFLRYDNDAHFLSNVTKEDVFRLFLASVHPSSTKRSKLSVQMKSQKPQPKRVSVAASREFKSHLQEAGFEIDDVQWTESLGADQIPTLSTFSKYWTDLLGPGTYIMALPDLGEDLRRPDAVYIQDPKAFKANLDVSVDPGPMVYWGIKNRERYIETTRREECDEQRDANEIQVLGKQHLGVGDDTTRSTGLHGYPLEVGTGIFGWARGFISSVFRPYTCRRVGWEEKSLEAPKEKHMGLGSCDVYEKEIHSKMGYIFTMYFIMFPTQTLCDANPPPFWF
ncbi:Metalloenzyme, LuxS/M16 peptidase-like protein [Infundibulicybe gibba]|nr:Metalloenzyme, LuxS/M16 peptidase-like protein [Infundibulicybe gibba]